jgi:hypothetical protein
MKSARLYKIENRLGEIARRPGGKRIADALNAAETRVKNKHAELAATLPEATLRLKALLDSASAAPGPALEGLYTESNQIFSLAAALDQRTLADAAYSLCDLVDGFRETGEISWQAVTVHVDAIRLLAAHPDSAQMRATILAGLRKVGARFQRPPPQAKIL